MFYSLTYLFMICIMCFIHILLCWHHCLCCLSYLYMCAYKFLDSIDYLPDLLLSQPRDHSRKATTLGRFTGVLMPVDYFFSGYRWVISRGTYWWDLCWDVESIDSLDLNSIAPFYGFHSTLVVLVLVAEVLCYILSSFVWYIGLVFAFASNYICYMYLWCDISFV